MLQRGMKKLQLSSTRSGLAAVKITAKEHQTRNIKSNEWSEAKEKSARQCKYLKCTEWKLSLNWIKTLFWKLQEQKTRKDDTCILKYKQNKNSEKNEQMAELIY